MSYYPALRQTVLDTADARVLAEFYRRLLGLRYRPGDEPPVDEQPDFQAREWLALHDDAGTPRLAFQPSDDYVAPTWPSGDRPQMVHLDLTVSAVDDLHRQRDRATELGARILRDRSNDSHEPLYVLGDPAGHPFCIFVAPGGPDDGH